MSAATGERGWNTKILNGRWPRGKLAMRPADVSDGLIEVMLARKNLLEDVNYSKIVPNHFIVEINPDNYSANYHPIEGQVLDQWNVRLLNHLIVTNSRHGRKEYRFGGRVRIQIRPAPDLQIWQARILARIETENSPEVIKANASRACLTATAGDFYGQRWLLHAGINTIGREPGSDIVLDSPKIREARLVSGQHAYLRIENGVYRLFDGSVKGKPSLNGTYVNYLPVPVDGVEIKDGDQIILAAENPEDPRDDTPGVAVFTFTLECG